MFLLIFKDILQIAFCQELLFQIMIALRLLTIVFLFSFRAKISLNALSVTRPSPKRWMKSISIRTQMIEAFDPANQLVKDEVLALPEE